MTVRILVGCRLGAVNQHDFCTALAEHDEIELYVVTESKNHKPIPGLDPQRVYHYHPTWPVIFARFHPHDKRQFQKILDEVDPDVLLSLAVSHLAFMGPTVDFSPTVFLPQGGKVNMSTRKRCKERNFGPRWIMYRPLMEELLRHVEEAWSAAPNESFLTPLGLSPERFRDFDWGVVDTEFFHPHEDPVSFADPETTVIGSFRRIRNPPLIPSYETFLDAAGLLAERRDDFHLVIGGFYEDDRGTEVEAVIEEKIAEHDLEDRVTTLEMVDKEELPRYYSGLDVYVNNSPVGSFAGVGTAAKEGMACGCAFVSFDEPPAGYLVDDGENGILAEHGDPESLADDFEQLCADAEYRRRLGSRARETVVERFSDEGVADRVVAACEEILAEGDSQGINAAVDH